MIDLKKVAIGYLTVVAVMATSLYLYKYLSPHTVWFEYKTVKVVKHVKAEKPLQFRSIRVSRRVSNLSGVDVLYCSTNDGLGYYSQASWNGGLYQPTIRQDFSSSNPWRYRGKVPVSGADCYLKSTIDLDLGYGIVKHQVIISDLFKIH